MDEYNVAGLDECISPLGDEQREALHHFWDQVLTEVWGPAPLPVPQESQVVDLAERRRRRIERRALVRVTRTVQLVESGPDFGGEAA